MILKHNIGDLSGRDQSRAGQQGVIKIFPFANLLTISYSTRFRFQI